MDANMGKGWRMKKMMFTAALLCAASVQAKVSLAPIFTDEAVLQRDKPVAIFGKADPGEKITVTFAGATAKATADASGKWLAELPAMQASAENRILTVAACGCGPDCKCDGTKPCPKCSKVEIKNVLVGEVWLCSGQSNMECTFWGGSQRYRSNNAGLLSQLANYPSLRIANVPRAWSFTPIDTAKIAWSRYSPNSDAVKGFSGAGMFFGIHLYQSLGIPVGMIESAWGGVNIQCFTSLSGFESVPSLKGEADFIKGNKFSAGPKDKPWEVGRIIGQPSTLFNAMINPLVPYTLRGALWYQGCSNRGQTTYAAMMHALYNGWAKEFKNPDLQFYFVQLAPYLYLHGGVKASEFAQQAANQQQIMCVAWNQQRAFAKEEPKAWMAVINDVGDFYDIHPRDKDTVGLRLAALALQHTYKLPVNADAPEAASAAIKDGKLVITVSNAQKLHCLVGFQYDATPRFFGNNDTPRYFEIAGADGNFVPADVKLDNNSLILSSPSVKEPKKARYLYAGFAQGNVFNEYGLPLDGFSISL